MSSHLIEIFEDPKLVNRIKTHLPYLFRLAELESSRAGKGQGKWGRIFTIDN